MSLLVDQYGDPLPDVDEFQPRADICPRCGDVDQLELLTGFGGWWRVVCSCGHEFARGRGEPPA